MERDIPSGINTPILTRDEIHGLYSDAKMVRSGRGGNTCRILSKEEADKIFNFEPGSDAALLTDAMIRDFNEGINRPYMHDNRRRDRCRG